MVLQEMEVIYLVTPTTETVNLILKDFKDPKRPQYGDVHLFFLSKVSDALVNRLGADPVSPRHTSREAAAADNAHRCGGAGGTRSERASCRQAGRAGG